MQGTTAKELHYELTPFLANNTTLFVKVRFPPPHMIPVASVPVASIPVASILF